MSVVERAINKLRSKERQPDGNAAAATAPTSPAASSSVALPSVNAAATGDRRPKQSLTVDWERLAAEHMVAPESQRRMVEDEFRRVKRKLLDSPPTPGALAAREVLITSSVPAEGKTFTSLNLALSFAQERDGGALLLDCDLARPRLSALFGVRKNPGLTDVLLDPSLDPLDVVFETDIRGFWFMPAGRLVGSAPELLASSRMREVRERIAAADPGRVMLFDSPPILASNEAQALTQMIDRVLMVVRAGSTSPDTLKAALAVIGESREFDCVFNGVQRIGGKTYYDYY